MRFEVLVYVKTSVTLSKLDISVKTSMPHCLQTMSSCRYPLKWTQFFPCLAVLIFVIPSYFDASTESMVYTTYAHRFNIQYRCTCVLYKSNNTMFIIVHSHEVSLWLCTAELPTLLLRISASIYIQQLQKQWLSRGFTEFYRYRDVGTINIVVYNMWGTWLSIRMHHFLLIWLKFCS